MFTLSAYLVGTLILWNQLLEGGRENGIAAALASISPLLVASDFILNHRDLKIMITIPLASFHVMIQRPS